MPQAVPAPPEARDSMKFVRDIRERDHACLIYESPEEALEIAGAYLAAGHQDGAKCLYITNDHSVTACRKAFTKSGIPVAEAELAGRFAVLNKHQAYLRSGTFDPDEMIEFLETAVRAEGGRPVRGAGEMSWALSSDVYLPKLIVYESKVNQIFSKVPFTALCLYDRRQFPAHVLNEIIRVHPIVLYGSRALRNVFYVPPSEYLSGAKDEAILQRTLRDLLVHNRIDPDIRRQDRTESTISVADLRGAA